MSAFNNYFEICAAKLTVKFNLFGEKEAHFGFVNSKEK